jgi:hypothetical protein
MDRAGKYFSNTHTHQKYLDLLKSFEGKKIQRARSPRINRKYLSWRELIPFQMVMFIKRRILKAI